MRAKDKPATSFDEPKNHHKSTAAIEEFRAAVGFLPKKPRNKVEDFDLVEDPSKGRAGVNNINLFP